MKKYNCTNDFCESPCELIVKDSDFVPDRCPFDSKMDKYLVWHEKEMVESQPNSYDKKKRIEYKFENWHVEKCAGKIEIKMPESAIALADTPENFTLARFIAVAPEMYEVLTRIKREMECDDNWYMITNDVNDVLKKAIGEK